MNDHLLKFFIFYMEKSMLGLITKYHVQWAENQRDGVKSKECKEIAKLHSVELDFGKKGK